MVNRESITVDSKESLSLISRIIKNVKNYNLVMDYINKKS
nr:MAG TPA: DASH complex subunit Dad4 [Caudoviricetes sp.]